VASSRRSLNRAYGASPRIGRSAHTRLPCRTPTCPPPGAAALVASFLEALDLSNATIVANDTGGAITQILMTEHSDRVGRVVLTSCDALERFLPPIFASLPTVARVPGSMWIVAHALRLRAFQRSPFALGWVAKRPHPVLDRGLVSAPHSSGRRDPP
jgi:pimeloyl-ACP methyl ester carboxylesterase